MDHGTTILHKNNNIFNKTCFYIQRNNALDNIIKGIGGKGIF